MTRERVSLATAAALAAAAFFAPVAHAHGESGVALSAVVESISPPVPGLSVTAHFSVAPMLEIRADTAGPVTVIGEHGEPFLRLRKRGVFGNVRSPTMRRSADPLADTPPAPLRGAAPKWRLLRRGRTWRFFDPRLRIAPTGSHARAPFTVPLRVGRLQVAVRGFVHLGEIGHLRAFLDEAPAVSGLELRLIQGSVPALFIRNETGRMLEVPGFEGEPFLRIGPGGVHANLRSPTYYRAGGQAIRPVPSDAHARAAPDWRLVSRQPTWAWLEHRATVPARRARALAVGSRRGTVARWTTRLRLGGRALAVAGHVEWIPSRVVPPAQAHPPPNRAVSWVVAAALLVLVAAIGGRVMTGVSSRREPAA